MRSVGGRWTVGIVESAVVADQFGLGEGRGLLVAILGPGYERFERVQLLHASRAALIGVQVYELARVREMEDRVPQSRRSCLCELLKDGAHERGILLFTPGLTV
jgi:hypothetical protein